MGRFAERDCWHIKLYSIKGVSYRKVTSLSSGRLLRAT
jgi:hypothetical protein